MPTTRCTSGFEPAHPHDCEVRELQALRIRNQHHVRRRGQHDTEITAVLASAFMPTTKITVNNDGSVRVEGDFEIFDPTGQAFGLGGRTVIGLCRCGQSQNKPFCDGSHARTGFQDKVVARDLPAPQTEDVIVPRLRAEALPKRGCKRPDPLNPDRHRRTGNARPLRAPSPSPVRAMS